MARPSTNVQTLIFSKDRFKTAQQAKAWAKREGYNYGLVDETSRSWRLRQIDPNKFKPDSFRTIEFTEGVKAVIGHLKSRSNPVAVVKKWAKEEGVPVSVAERRWRECEKSAEERSPKDKWAYTMGCFKRRMGRSNPEEGEKELIEAFHDINKALKKIREELAAATGAREKELSRRALSLAWMRKDVYSRIKDYYGRDSVRGLRLNPFENRVRIPGGLAAGMRPRDFDPMALAKGSRVEMEHTYDPEIAQEIAMDHLVEDPRYYEKLELIEKNPIEPSSKIREAYMRFHGVEPTTIDEMKVWVPGPMVYLGPCIDIGYKPPKGSEKAPHEYVHDHKEGVKVYCRPDIAPEGVEPSIHYKKFPSEIWALGINIGFTYQDRFDGKEYEIEGSSRRKLCTDSSGKKLYVVDNKGILFMVKGGNLQITNWIRN